ncbi:NUT member 1 [Saguinus oedipus]|uniref:NUT member 1 n=1 Tax=Saguinus oedipus TaxID=9490 RepID=A0ABQ9V3R7_SAGOE|nr:NUT member 1 [Saguinus oedipus]
MTLEEGLPKAVQEWEHTSNFDRMIFYEMAEKFMEFEAEEMQIQNIQLMKGSQGLSSATPLKLYPPGLLASEVCQQPAYTLKKAAPKAQAPRRRQRKPRRPPVPETPEEIPPEAVQEYVDIMEELVGTHLATGESDGKQEEEEWQQQEEEGLCSDPGLLSYINELCSQKVFVSKVEAIIHPQFLADLLSPEKHRDPLALIEELEQEEGLTFTQLVQKRLLSLEEEEDVEASLSYSGTQLESSPSVSDEDENRGGQFRPSPGLWGAGGAVRLGKVSSSGKRAREVHGGQKRSLDSPREMHRDGNTLPAPSSWDLQPELAAPQGTLGSLGMERRGSGKVINQVFPCQDGHLGGAGSPGHCLVADRTSEALPLCWQKSFQPKSAPSLDVGLAELAPLQGQGLEKQILGLQKEQTGGCGVLPQGKEPLAVPQEASSGAMWGDDRGTPTAQSYDQNLSLRAAGDKDEVSLSLGLWLSSEMDTAGMELPIQIEEVVESFQVEECATEYQEGCQELGSRGISLCPGETIVPGDTDNSVIPCGGTVATAALEKGNYCTLPGPLRANSSTLRSKKNREQSHETIGDPNDLWAEGCLPLLESRIGGSTLGSARETLQPTCQGNLLILGTQDTASLPEASQEAGSRGNSFSPLLETPEQVNILDVKDDYGLQRVSEDTCPLNVHSYDPEGEGGVDPDLSKPKNLAPLQESQESYTTGTLKATFHQGLGSTSPRWGTRDAKVLRETSVSKTHRSADRAKRKGKKKGKEAEKEDEELSNFAYLLASKLSLSPKGHPVSPHHTSGGQGSQRASHLLSSEATGPSKPPNPVAKSEKQALVGGPAPTEKRPHSGAQLGVCGEKPLALGVVRPSQRRKRRRDSFVTGRRKKRRRSQ